MTQILLNVFSVLVAVAMVALILLQRGPGAAAGSAFGAGASATVFGARGSASFLTRSTAVLATVFFALTMGHAMHVNRADIRERARVDTSLMNEFERPAPTAPARGELPTLELESSDLPTVDEDRREAEPVDALSQPRPDEP